MGVIPTALKELTLELQRLPGIGPKSARRLAYYMFSLPQDKLDGFSKTIRNLKESVTVCSFCKSLADTNPCELCADEKREKDKLCVVSDHMDVYAIERSGSYNGMYYVLGGVLSPAKGVGPETLQIVGLEQRIKQLLKGRIEKLEIILAFSPTTEGQTTVLFLKEHLAQKGFENIKISKVAVGLSVGADIDFVDTYTLQEALRGRSTV